MMPIKQQAAFQMGLKDSLTIDQKSEAKAYEVGRNMKNEYRQKSDKSDQKLKKRTKAIGQLKGKFKLNILVKAMVSTFALASALMLGVPVQAQQIGGATLISSVKAPNNEYQESTIDLRVKVLGGAVLLERAWINGQWYINPHWTNLRFRLDPLDDSVKSIDRAGVVYNRSGDSALYSPEGVNVYIREIEDGWRWYDLEGNWINYNQAGVITSYGDRNDIQVTFDLDYAGRISAVKDHHGQTVLTFTYGQSAMPTQVSDQDGRTVTYAWDEGKLLAATDVLGYTWMYSYDSHGQLSGRVDPDGGTMLIQYAYPVEAVKPTVYSKMARGIKLGISRKTQREDPIVPVSRITNRTNSTTLLNRTYDNTKRQFTVEENDPQGNQIVTVYDIKGRLISRTVNGDVRSEIERDGKYLARHTNQRGLVTTTHYNEREQPLRITRADGSTLSYTYEANYGNRTSYTDALGNKDEYIYNDKGNLTYIKEAVDLPEERSIALEYDNPYGLPSIITVSRGIEKSITLHRTYDAAGNVETMTDAQGNTFSFTYNTLGQMLTAQNPLGETWVYQYNAAGHPERAVDPLGSTVRYNTDMFGRITQRTDELGNKSYYSYNYEANGLTLNVVIRETNALDQTITYRFNHMGKLLSVTSPSGSMQTWMYDNEGRPVQMQDEAGSIINIEYGVVNSGLDGMVVASVYPTYTENYKYNVLDLPVVLTQTLSEQESLTSRNSYNAAGQLVARTDAAGRTVMMDYDAFGNETVVIDVMGNEIVQTWNALNQITSVTDALGNKHQFEYDPNGNLVKEITPSGEATLYTYDAANQLIQRVDAVGNVTVFTYDAAGRLVQETHTAFGSVTAERTIEYLYNTASQLIEVSQVGSNTIATRHVYTLDALGRKTQETVTYGTGHSAISQTIKYSYTVDGELASVTYPGGQTQSYAYQHSQLSGITLPNGEEMTIGDYDWMQPTSVQAPGLTQVFDYDALQRLQNIDVKNNGSTDGNTGSNTQLVNTSYAYDAVGNIILRHTKDGKYTYGYDAASRLTQVEPPETLQQAGLPQEAYAYDPVGNRIGSAQQPGDWQYNANNQLLIYGEGADKTVYTYTPNGHVATQTRNGQTLTYHYDASDRLVRITSITNAGATPTEVASYAYDALGRRIAKTVNGETTYFLYTEEGLIAELDDGGNTRVAYGWQPDTMYGTAPLWQANIATGKTLQTADYHYIITDHLGTPIMTVNKDGEVTWQALTEAFGKTMPSAQNHITMNLRFPGQYYDQETGTHYNYFRDYNPQTGRYIQRDPIGLNGGINTYGYVNGSPVRFFDNQGKSLYDSVQIVEAIRRCIGYMNIEGRRYNRMYNNTIRSFQYMKYGRSQVLDCSEQTTFVITECLNKLSLDDKWVFYTRAGVGHAWGIAHPENPNDPIIWFDARAGEISFNESCSTCSGWGFGLLDIIIDAPTGPIENQWNTNIK